MNEATKAYLRQVEIKAAIRALKKINKTDDEIFSYLEEMYNAGWKEFQRLKEETEQRGLEEK